MSLLSKLFKKRGIDSVEELSSEERATFDRYQTILRGEAVTVELIKKFCQTQIKQMENQFAQGETKNDLYIKACLHVYLNFIKMIEAPDIERENLEIHLNQLIAN